MLEETHRKPFNEEGTYRLKLMQVNPRFNPDARITLKYLDFQGARAYVRLTYTAPNGLTIEEIGGPNLSPDEGGRDFEDAEKNLTTSIIHLYEGLLRKNQIYGLDKDNKHLDETDMDNLKLTPQEKRTLSQLDSMMQRSRPLAA